MGAAGALQGGMGSLFMTHQNAKNIYLGLNTAPWPHTQFLEGTLQSIFGEPDVRCNMS